MIKFIKKNPLISLPFLIYFIIGLQIFKDFGIGIEEHFQRSSGFYWLSSILEFTNFENLKNVVNQKIIEINNFSPNLPPLDIANYYGIIFDLPMALIESLFNVNSSLNYFYIRHLTNFTIFFISGIFFFKTLKLRTSNNIISLLGASMYLLAPKTFGNSFFDGKDLFFLSILTITFYYYFAFENKRNLKNLIFLALFSAFATSSRIFGLMLPITFIFLILLELLNPHIKKQKIFKTIFAYLLIYLVFLYAHWPYMWTIDIHNISNFFSPFKVHGLHKVFFDGQFYESNYLPISYLPKWILISTPIYILILFLIGYLFYLKRLFLRFLNIEEISLNNDIWKGYKEKFDLITFFCFFQVIAVYFTLNINLIKGWTHFIFLNYFLIYFSSIGAYVIFLSNRKSTKILSGLSFIFLIFTFELVYKLKIYHPYQSLYLNNLVSESSKSKYEADYQSLSRVDAIKEILNDSPKKNITIATASWTPLKNGISLIFSNNNKNIKFIGTANKEKADYIYSNYFYEIDSRYNKKYNIKNNFYLFKSLYIDGIKVYSIYKKTS